MLHRAEQSRAVQCSVSIERRRYCSTTMATASESEERNSRDSKQQQEEEEDVEKQKPSGKHGVVVDVDVDNRRGFVIC